MKSYWELKLFSYLDCDWCMDGDRNGEFYKVEDDVVCRECLESEKPSDNEALSAQERNT